MDTVLGWSHVRTTSLKASLGPQLRICRAPGQVRRSHRFVGGRVLTTSLHIAWLFWAVSTAQMMSWAVKKQRAYKKEFGKDYPRQRKAMIPFLFSTACFITFVEVASRQLLKVSLGSYPLRNSSNGHACIIPNEGTRDSNAISCSTARALILSSQMSLVESIVWFHSPVCCDNVMAVCHSSRQSHKFDNKRNQKNYIIC